MSFVILQINFTSNLRAYDKPSNRQVNDTRPDSFKDLALYKAYRIQAIYLLTYLLFVQAYTKKALISCLLYTSDAADE